MKDKILKLIELKQRIFELEKNDKEKEEIISSNPYALSEGFETRNMRLIEELEEEIKEITLD